MNIVLWVLQAALALLYLAGGAYKVFAFDELASDMSVLPRGVWSALGVIEMAGGVLLLGPAPRKWRSTLTSVAAAVLAVETTYLVGVYARYSLEWSAINPLPWAAVMALLVAVVAYGRYRLRPQV